MLAGSVAHARSGTPEEIAKLADGIYQEVKNSGIPKEDEKGRDELLKQFQEKYRDFMVSFPFVLRWMVQAHEYDTGTFLKYLKYYAKYCAKNPAATAEDTSYLQLEYLVFLYKCRHRPYSSNDVNKYRDRLRAQVKKESDEFKAEFEKVEEELTKKKRIYAQDKRRELADLLRSRLEPKPAEQM